MITKSEKQIDWEPLVIRLVAPTIDPNRIDALRDTVTSWLKSRDQQPACKSYCKTKYVNIHRTDNGLKLSVQWMCDECLGHVLNLIESNFQEIEQAIIGYPQNATGRIPIQ